MCMKAVSDTVLDMKNAFYHDNPLIFIRAISLAVSDTVFGMINSVYHDKPLILSGLLFGRSSSPIIRQ